MFGLGFLSRKLGAASTSSGTANNIPSPEAEPPVTPSPPPRDLITDPNPLHALIASVPAQTFHAYTLAHLIPPAQPLSPLSFPHSSLPSDPPNPRTLTALTNFFASLVPPPRLHCTRCHKSYFEVENTDRSCLVPHDDESAEVERVGASSRSKGIGTEYETLWGCCGKTVEGDGDMGPPDGWCYEGKHTTDIKRARFRADSTPYDDKLTSCERLRCHEPPSSSPGATRGGANKRRRALIEADNEDAQSSADGSTASGASSNSVAVDETTSARKPKRARHSKSLSTSSKADLEKSSKDDDEAMDVDPTSEPQMEAQVPVTPKSAPRSRKPRKSTGRATTPREKSKPKSPLVASFTPPSPPAEDDLQPQADKGKTPLPLPQAVIEITTARDGSPRLANSASHGDLQKTSCPSLAGSSKEGGKAAQPENEKPKSKLRASRSTIASASAPRTPKASKASAGDSKMAKTPTTKPKSSSGSLKPKSSVASLKSSTNMEPPSTTPTPHKPVSRAGSTRRKAKALNEVVATSVEGEEHL